MSKDVMPTTGVSLAGEATRTWNDVEVDPITLRVIGGALDSTAKEMAQVLYRMAYSSLIRESEDLGAGLFDVNGRELCESDSTPMHCGSIPAYIRGINRRLAGTYKPGDVVLHNHPYHGAAHSPDYGVVIPIFWEGEHVGFAGCTGHVSDIGGNFPGLCMDVVDVWAEGKLIDSMKIYDGGVRNDALIQHILDNVRTPEQNRGDLEALIASARIGEKRFVEMLEKYGLDVVMSSAERWMDYSEEMLRSRIRAIPDGSYEAPVGYLDDDGKNRDVPVAVAVRVQVEGDEILIDLTGSSPQVPTAFNVPFEGSVLPVAVSAIRTILLDEAVIDEYVPQNDGCFRPVKAYAPEGTIFNPDFPASCFARFSQVNRVFDSINLALAPVLPDHAIAGSSAALCAIAYSGLADDGESYWVYIEINEGSYGGRQGKDGMDAVDALMANTRNNPIEELELNHAMRALRYELRDDAPAPGKWRGGIGSHRSWLMLTDTFLGSEADNRSDPPAGALGGHDGVSGSFVRNVGTDREEVLYSKVTQEMIRSGDTLDIKMPSGGGFGDPFERDAFKVLSDVWDEYLTAEDAARDYGVVVDTQTWTIDEAGTERLRAARAAV
ncbi:hydantoinase B/oxoprolinase family protein [Aeromicrobium wangtongii]|uniref:Hydantoinase B/oxoprolinase family protein n=1 Tax=Aeromicrobium wangtongii TaxID=2969247 RepID=A0ABY5MES1_9ACTN|nr:hydantoinase B/oxoprolinase family protein [Aeromicrobium wangtongii]MCD9197754.1 hydantoinase B/oxoprolinase family protein [Aeromicrobium wangtongii]MCL3819568.1 hydantoinase B/oxoprolinase family protein [Aeromicrobium wangtongii]UUP15237.1 hydantoinase B/oxoprolinase family protein [Aeromicrobium wangtongii]